MSFAAAFSGVTKRFSRQGRVRTLADLLFSMFRRRVRDADGLLPSEFFALRDVTFSVAPGESLGIVGPNGSGKSTILKLLFRILRPDAGQVRTQGRVGGLIELGAGFHPYLTGRENVFINGAILGMTRAETRKRYDSIVEFAGIADFMGMPVKDYSSGMYARLAFAIAAHAEPDVLLVDEVLAVGDTEFQLKCYDWMARMRKSGRAIIAVSHDMYAMAASTRCLYLNKGQAITQGEPREVIERYLGDLAQGRSDPVPESSFVRTADGKPRAEVTAVELLDHQGRAATTLGSGDSLTIRFHFRVNDEVESPIFALSLFHDDPRIPLSLPRHYLFHVSSGAAFRSVVLRGSGCVEVQVSDVRLPVGIYRVKTYLHERDVVSPIHVRDGAGRIEIQHAPWADGLALMDQRQHWTMPAIAEVP